VLQEISVAGDHPTDMMAMATQLDPVETAEAAGLRYMMDTVPGVRRSRRGRGFSYTDPQGKKLSVAARKRVEALVIPPAWTDVWISPSPNSHLQATGRDEKGRKQFIYHPRWQEIRSQTKFNRLPAFGELLPLIRERADQDLKATGLPRPKVLAAIVKLLETTLIRIGNQEYAAKNDSYGLTTLRDDQIDVSGSTLHFEFTGKSGKPQSVDLRDRRLAKVIQQCKEIPGYELFQYIDENEERQIIDSGDVNDYLREITGEAITAKDFRTWGGTLHAFRTLIEAGPAETVKAARSSISAAIKQAAGKLGNTTTVCRQYYVHPDLCEAYQSGRLFDLLKDAPPVDDSPYTLDDDEAALIVVLRKLAEEGA